jgi:2'-5' RNA ligase
MTQEKSALYLVVPDAEVLLDAVRGMPGVTLLEPAHITLAYPWVGDPEARLDDVRTACGEVPAATVVLHGPSSFEQDVRGRTVVHASLSDERVPQDLAARLASPLRTPHLSIARVRRSGDVDEVVAAVAHLLPLTVRLELVEVTRRDPSGWTTILTAPLG